MTTCSVEGCDQPRHRRGWCSRHYERWRRHGDPLAGRASPNPGGPICRIEGCGRPSFKRGWCSPHYHRWNEYGDPLAGGRFKAPGAKCSVESCERPVIAQGYCNMHYQRWNQHGDPLIVRDRSVPAQNPAWKGDRAGYGAAHRRLGSITGRICVDCGQPAQEWSYVGGAPDERRGSGTEKVSPYSLDPNYYVPRCHACHVKHDIGGEKHYTKRRKS